MQEEGTHSQVLRVMETPGLGRRESSVSSYPPRDSRKSLEQLLEENSDKKGRGLFTNKGNQETIRETD